MNHTICHFEIPAEDVKKLTSFYSKLFGWKINKAAEDYYLIDTGGVGGGIIEKKHPNHQPANYILVESVEEYSKKAEELGGKVVMSKTPVPGMGWFAVLIDPEGNQLALWQDDKSAK